MIAHAKASSLRSHMDSPDEVKAPPTGPEMIKHPAKVQNPSAILNPSTLKALMSKAVPHSNTSPARCKVWAIAKRPAVKKTVKRSLHHGLQVQR